VLHPGLKWKWLEKAWPGRPSWISRARVEVNKLWLEYADITVTTKDTESLRVEDNARWMDDGIITSLEGTFENVAMYPIDMEIED
jgi:hypothetical protein